MSRSTRRRRTISSVDLKGFLGDIENENGNITVSKAKALAKPRGSYRAVNASANERQKMLNDTTDEELIRKYTKDLLRQKKSNDMTENMVDIAKRLQRRTKYVPMPNRFMHRENFPHAVDSLESKRQILVMITPMLEDSEKVRKADVGECERFTRCRVERSPDRGAFEYVDVDSGVPIDLAEYESRYMLFINRNRASVGASPSKNKIINSDVGEASSSSISSSSNSSNRSSISSRSTSRISNSSSNNVSPRRAQENLEPAPAPASARGPPGKCQSPAVEAAATPALTPTIFATTPQTMTPRATKTTPDTPVMTAVGTADNALSTSSSSELSNIDTSCSVDYSMGEGPSPPTGSKKKRRSPRARRATLSPASAQAMATSTVLDDLELSTSEDSPLLLVAASSSGHDADASMVAQPPKEQTSAGKEDLDFLNDIEPLASSPYRDDDELAGNGTSGLWRLEATTAEASNTPEVDAPRYATQSDHTADVATVQKTTPIAADLAAEMNMEEKAPAAEKVLESEMSSSDASTSPSTPSTPSTISPSISDGSVFTFFQKESKAAAVAEKDEGEKLEQQQQLQEGHESCGVPVRAGPSMREVLTQDHHIPDDRTALARREVRRQIAQWKFHWELAAQHAADVARAMHFA